MREHNHDFNLRDSFQWLWVTAPSYSETINLHLCLCEVMGAHDGNIFFWSPWVFHVIHVVDIDRRRSELLRAMMSVARSISGLTANVINCYKSNLWKEQCGLEKTHTCLSLPDLSMYNSRQTLQQILLDILVLYKHHVLYRSGTDNILQPILVVFIWAGSYTCCFCFLFYFK